MPGVEFLAFGGEPLIDGVCKREIHVVATQQDVVADGHTGERHVAVFGGHRNERKVGGAAADVHDQHHVAGLDLFAEAFAHLLKPRVERRLRLFNQRDVWQAGLLRGFQREVARGGIERRWHGQNNILFGQGIILELVIPGFAQVGQVTRRRIQWRDALDVFGRLPRKDRAQAIHAGMTEPAFRGGDQPHRDFAAVRPCEFTDDRVFALLVPGQGETAGGKFLIAGQVKERRQQLLFFDGADGRNLRDGEHGLRAAAGLGFREFEIRDRAVGGAEVNADGVSGHETIVKSLVVK